MVADALNARRSKEEEVQVSKGEEQPAAGHVG